MNVNDLNEIVHDAYDNKGKSIEFFSHIDKVAAGARANPVHR